MTSCITYKEVFNDKYYVEEDKTSIVVENVNIGDWVGIKVNGQKHYNLLVTGINERTLTVSKHVDNVKHYYPIHIPYIEKLEVQIPDPMYTLGAGYTSLLLIFFLL